jgi:regulator of protease activity HflC (stomatin/prohibitin superfamily)
VILDPTMGAVKFVRGSKIVPCGPGIHFYWPAITNLVTYPTARQADNLPSQTIATSDDRTITISSMVVYEVSDIAKLLSSTYSAQSAIGDIALTAIHDVCCQLTWDQLKSEQRKGTLDTKLKHATQKALNDFGVRVLKVMLTDLAPARVYRLINSTTKDE